MNKGTRGVHKKEGSMDQSLGDDSTPEQSPAGVGNGSGGGTARKRKRQDPVRVYAI